MSRFIKHIVLFLWVSLIAAQGFGQLSLPEMIHYGDAAYEQGNYASAIYFYEMVTNEELKVERASSNPYGMAQYSGKSKRIDPVEESATSDTTIVEPVANKKDGTIDQNEAYATHMIAECARLMNDYLLAEQTYVISLQLNWGGTSSDYPLDPYWYATVLMNNENYELARMAFNNFILDHEDNQDTTMLHYIDLSKKQIKNCKYAASSASHRKGVSVTKGDSLLNNGSTSFAASYYSHDQILISSARNISRQDLAKEIPSEQLSDIFLIRKNGDSWEGAEALIGDLNTEHHEGAASVGKNTSTMYFTRWKTDNDGLPKVYVSKYFVNKWMKAR
ncbi:MAG: hypothetical protein JKY54_01345, partial [Flavobacteriales bacterium]|nr:hypothetical protein [Flavobacteriales bacterium]